MNHIIRISLIPIITILFLIIPKVSLTQGEAAQGPLTVKVGIYVNKPKLFINDSGKVAGFWPELLEYIADKEGWQLEYVQGSWLQGLKRLKDREIDIMPDVADTPKRNMFYDFSEAPVLLSWSVLYVNKENHGIASITDLNNKTIAVGKGSVNFDGTGGIKELADKFDLKCRFMELEGYATIFKALENNHAHAGVISRTFGDKNEEKFAVKKTSVIFQPMDIKFAFPKNAPNPHIEERINAHLKQLKDNNDSVYYRLLEKYFEAEIAEKTVEVFPGWAKALLQIAMALLLIFTTALIISRTQVKRKTRELWAKHLELQESEELFSLFMDYLPLKVFIKDENSTTLFVNKRMKELLGEKDWIGKSVSDIYPKELAEAVLADDREVLSTGYKNIFEEIPDINNDVHFYNTQKFRIERPGKPPLLGGVSMDITELEMARKEMQMTNERFQIIMDSLDSFVYISDMNTHEVLFINKHGREVWGDIIGKTCWKCIQSDLSGPCDFCTNNRIVDAHGNPTGVYVWEFRNTVTNRWYECRDQAIRWTDGRLVRLEIATDITERKRSREMMIQSEKMLSVGGLAAGMAHEINNPLAGMMQNAQVLLNRFSNTFPADEKAAVEAGTTLPVIKDFMEKRNVLQTLQSIHRAGQQAAKIVENMLSFARKDSSKHKQHIHEIMDKTLMLAQNDYDLKKKYDFRQFRIIKEYDPDLPLVSCEGSKLQQVIFNILKNATEAMAEHRQADKPPCLTLRLKNDTNKIRMEIEDNGPGMDKKISKRIFEPFFTTKETDKGTGLGLSLSYFIIVEDHGGEMNIESTPGKGTKFIITLPV
ncbi:MAG: transporter substrate-binding domain-containing protein [Desulfobacteraceae bacterium]|nr:transporter substrate-binding domain-containing protein [Desulfobacteraceae bacterium]